MWGESEEFLLSLRRSCVSVTFSITCLKKEKKQTVTKIYIFSGSIITIFSHMRNERGCTV